MFQCLLETCERKFATAAERKRHLIDAHAFPKGFRFDSVHMRRHKGQVNTTATIPLPPGALHTLQTPPGWQCALKGARRSLLSHPLHAAARWPESMPVCRCGRRQSCVGTHPKLDVGMPRKQVGVRPTPRPWHRALQM